MRKITCAICLVLFVDGCAIPTPTQEKISKAYYGPYPDSYESIIKDFMYLRLIDGQSAIYQFKAPYKGYSNSYDNENPFLLGPVEHGWVVRTLINTKNRMGEYCGFKKTFFLIRDGQVRTYDIMNLQ